MIGEQFNYQFGDDKGEMIEEKIPLAIVGVGKKPAKDWVQDQKIYADASIIPEIEKIYYANVGKPVDDHSEAQQLFYGNVNVYADKLENVKAISTALKDEGYSVYSISDELDQLDVFFLALKAGLVFVGTIAILIASIGILDTMTMAVTRADARNRSYESNRGKSEVNPAVILNGKCVDWYCWNGSCSCSFLWGEHCVELCAANHCNGGAR